MRNCVLAEKSRLLLRGAAVVVLAGLATGCSSDLSRFTYKDFTGSVSRPSIFRRAPKPQPFPDAPIAAQQAAQADISGETFDAPPPPGKVTRSVLAPVAAAGSAVAATAKRVTAPVIEAAKSVVAPVTPARQTVTPVDLATVQEAPAAPKVKLIRKKLADEAKPLDTAATGSVEPKVRKVEISKHVAEPLSVSEETDAQPKLKGARIWGGKIDDAGHVTPVSPSTKFERTHCKRWQPKVACGDQKIATGIRGYFYDVYDKGFSGMGLRCSTIAPQ